ncbi:UPF0449 protein C19orf25 homolog [Rhinatrema bivittatum]|uniref:UPF0449 protein C19orf25 homolog n=1 Tax=Rhinatrema bivittatum TaxID=194408 RepID=UPI00112ABC99|nr:UPF0449 protein C19orf25 homolog [Rhinatrema bivittatum]
MTSKVKKRVVLPTRPSPPSIEQILEDVQAAPSSDPVFALGAEIGEEAWDEDLLAEREKQYRQSYSYVELNHRLQQACSLMKIKCQALKQAGEVLDHKILEIKEKNLVMPRRKEKNN